MWVQLYCVKVPRIGHRFLAQFTSLGLFDVGCVAENVILILPLPVGRLPLPLTPSPLTPELKIFTKKIPQ